MKSLSIVLIFALASVTMAHPESIQIKKGLEFGKMLLENTYGDVVECQLCTFVVGELVRYMDEGHTDNEGYVFLAKMCDEASDALPDFPLGEICDNMILAHREEFVEGARNGLPATEICTNSGVC